MMITIFLTLLGLASQGHPRDDAGHRFFFQERVSCDGSGVDPWVSGFRDRVMSHDGLARFARERFGAPTACEGVVTTVFDGAKFGTLLLSFPGGISLEVVTMPIESSVTTLRGGAGFSDEVEIRQVLKSYVEGIGLTVDWAAPELVREGTERISRYWDHEEGLNASASLIFSGERLMAIRVSMAL